jgi:hypothetical protein
MNNAALTRRCRPLFCALALVGAQLLTLTACDSAESLDVGADSHADSDDELRNGSNLQLALWAVDMMADEIMNSNPMEDEFLQQRLQHIYDGAPFAQLTPSEQMQVDVHIANWASQLQNIGSQISDASTPQTDDLPPEQDICYTKCFIIVEFACENSQVLGLCQGLWGCGAGNGAHECLEDETPEGEPCGSSFCDEDERCAKWVVKPHECVTPCETNADCPGTQSCVKPFGTWFHRCR